MYYTGPVGAVARRKYCHVSACKRPQVIFSSSKVTLTTEAALDWVHNSVTPAVRRRLIERRHSGERRRRIAVSSRLFALFDPLMT